MSLRRVARGDRFQPSAEERNAVVDLLSDLRQRQRAYVAGLPELGLLRPTVAEVVNETGAARAQYQILGVSQGPYFTAGSDSFRERLTLRGRVPVSGDEAKFVILLDDSGVAEASPAAIDGCCWVKVDVTDLAHRFAQAKIGSTTELESVAEGSAEIVWLQTASTGTQWAMVRLRGVGPVAKTLRYGVVVSGTQLQPTGDRSYVGTIYAQETSTPTGSASGPTLTIRVPHRARPSDPDTTTAYPPSRFYLPIGSRIAFQAGTDGALVLVSDYDEWERDPLFYGKVVNTSGSLSGGTPDTRTVTGRLPDQVRLLVVDPETGNPLGAPFAGAEVWVGVGPEPAGNLTVGQTLAFRRDIGVPLNEAANYWPGWDTSTTGLIAVAGFRGLRDCQPFGCGITVGTKEVSDDHSGELRIRRGKTTPDNGAKPRRELRLAASLKGRAVGTPGVARIKLPGLPPTSNPTRQFPITGSPEWRLARHLYTTGARDLNLDTESVVFDYSRPGLTGNVAVMAALLGGSNGTFRGVPMHLVFEAGVLVDIIVNVNGAGLYTGALSSITTTEIFGEAGTPNNNELWPTNCCE